MNPEPQYEIEEEIHLSEYFRILRRQKWTIFTVFLVTVTAVTIVSIMKIPIYRATATLFIDQESSNVLTISDNNMAMGNQSYATYKEYFQSQKEIIKSRTVLEQVFNELKLNRLPQYTQKNTAPSASSWTTIVKKFISNLTGAVTGNYSEEDVAEYPNKIDLVDEFTKNIKVVDIRNTRLLKLSVENRDPVLAADIANRIAQVYVERNLAYISKSEILNLQKNEYLKLQARLSEYAKVYKTKHPKILRTKEKMDEVSRRIKQERDENLPGYKSVISTSDLTSLKANNVSVQDWANPVFRPVKPNKRKNILLSVIVGLFGGVGLAFFIEYLDNTIKTAEDVEHLVDWPFLGYIPLIRGKKEKLDFLVHSKPKSSASEAFRTIRTSLLFSSTKENPLKSILLTSPGQQEGKSTTINNIAIAMAQNNKKTLLVDADMRKPRLHYDYEIDNTKGLSTFLSGQSPFENIVNRTKVDNLSFIGCGPHPPNPSELLASGKMNDFITQAKEKFDFIFFDTSPIIVVTDVIILSKIVDGTVIILESGKTSKKIVPMLRQTLTNAKSRVIGLIINKIKAQSGEYHSYSSYYGEEDKI